MCQHESHKVDETKTRSFLKVISARTIEVIADTIILSFVGIPIFESIGLAILIESVCLSLCYVLERIWNKIMWGRKIVVSDVSY